MKIAAITMVYNEARAIRRWVDYYSRQVGAENCYIVDHGSDDGSTTGLGAINVVRIPRSPQDNQKRADSISHFANSLLCWYDYVLYVDCDEFLVPDPRKYQGLWHYCETARPDYVTSIGINVIHAIETEAELAPDKPVLSQRAFGMFVSAMAKPNLTSVPVLWSPGFHFRDKPAVFGDLFLIHLKYADISDGLARLRITREMAWQSDTAGAHQRVVDEEWLKRVKAWNRMPIAESDPWSIGSGVLQGYTEKIVGNQFFAPHRGIYFVTDDIRAGFFGKELLRFPAAFKDIL